MTPWTVAHEVPLSKGFSRQEYWSGLPCPPPGDLPNPGPKPRSPALQVDYLPFEPPGKMLLDASPVVLAFKEMETKTGIICYTFICGI